MSIIDTHCHLDNIQYENDVDEVIKRGRQNGVELFLIPGADPKYLPKAVALSEKYDDVYFSVGVHPYDAYNFDIDILKKYIDHPKCIAIGECGLDYYRLPEDSQEKEEYKRLQKKVFIAQIELAKQINKPLIVHIREATDDSKTILIDNEAKKVGGVLHCFNASEHLLPLSEHGFYFGIGGVVTFKNAKKLAEILSDIPLDKIVIETDGPYLTPHPHRGTRNEPCYTKLVVEKISQLLKIDENEVENLTTNNAKTLFKGFNR